MLLIKRHHFFVQFVRTFFVLLAQFCHLGLNKVHPFHGHVADAREREEYDIDQDRQRDDGEPITAADFL